MRESHEVECRGMKTVHYLMLMGGALGLVSCYGTKEFTIITEPSGAQITLNGKEVGTSNLTVEIDQRQDLGIVAVKPGYQVAAATVETKVNPFLSFIWTDESPYARYIDEDEVTIPLRRLMTTETYRPTTLEPYTGGGGRTAPGGNAEQR